MALQRGTIGGHYYRWHTVYRGTKMKDIMEMAHHLETDRGKLNVLLKLCQSTNMCKTFVKVLLTIQLTDVILSSCHLLVCSL